MESNLESIPSLDFLIPLVKVDDALRSLCGDKIKLLQLIKKLVRQFKSEESYVSERLRRGDYDSIVPIMEQIFRLAAQIGYVDLIEESWQCTNGCKTQHRYISLQSWVNMCMLVDQIDRLVTQNERLGNDNLHCVPTKATSNV